MKTVLLAYERDQDLAALETLLQSRGHQVLKARSGVDALEVTRRETPHVIVSDVLLPKLDGFALCRRVKEDPLLQHLPVLLMSFRVEGAKYEAFAAEVGADRFLPRGATLDELATAIDEAGPSSGTMRIPALVPELLEKRAQDRRRVAELERQLKELEDVRQQLAAAERVARESAERAAAERSELAAAEGARIRQLEGRIAELEQQQRTLAQSESAARGAAERTRAELARTEVLETRLAELQAARARAQAAAVDAERAFAAQPLPTWLSDMETHELRALSDSAAALFGIASDALRGRSIVDLLPGYAPDAESGPATRVPLVRSDGEQRTLELSSRSVSYSGRACWLTVARDVSDELARSADAERLGQQALVLQHAPQATVLADAEGRLHFGNAAFRELSGLGHDDTLEAARLQQFLVEDGGERRWRRADGALLDVEVAEAPFGPEQDLRVLTLRDVGEQRRGAGRAARATRRAEALLELAQRAHSQTESELQTEALELACQLTQSPVAWLFMALPEAGHVELAACCGNGTDGKDLSVLTRWRGAPGADTALGDCLEHRRAVARDALEGTGPLREAGLPGSLRRQACVPMLDGGRLAGMLLLADRATAYEDEDLQHAAQVADALWKMLRRRRSDAEVVSAMDHMERVMLGVVDALATLAEAQDAGRTGRARRVAEMAASIGTALGLPGHTVRGLRVMGQLLDVGMLQIPREVLWRPGQLPPAEYELVKTHAERGYETLRRVEFPWPVADVVRQHHERLDGSGYPRGLKGDEILLEARIVAVADAAEAMLSQRPQRAALSLAACIDELQSQAGRRYDARVVKACVKLLREREARNENEATVGQRIA